MTFKVFRFQCPQCGTGASSLQWAHDPAPSCCGLAMLPEQGPERAHTVIGDDIPGGQLLEHIAYKDGRPQRFYSKNAMKEAARAAGYTHYDETPKSTKYREV